MSRYPSADDILDAPGDPFADAAPDDAHFDRLVGAIVGQESGGNYRAVNKDSGALGRYQIMPSNLGAWGRKHAGRAVAPDEFLSSDELQDRIGRGQLREYYDDALAKSGGDRELAARRVAAAWYSGDPNLYNSTKPQGGYPSIAAYTQSVASRARDDSGVSRAAAAPPQMPSVDDILDAEGDPFEAPAVAPKQFARQTRKARQRETKKLAKGLEGVLAGAAPAIEDVAGAVGAIGRAFGIGDTPAPEASGEPVPVRVTRDSLGRPRIKGSRGESFKLTPQGNLQLASSPDLSSEEVRKLAGVREYERQLERDRAAARTSGDEQALSAEFDERERQLQFMRAELEQATNRRAIAADRLQGSTKIGRITRHDLEDAVGRVRGEQDEAAGDVAARIYNRGTLSPTSPATALLPMVVGDVGRLNRIATREIEDRYAIDPYSGDRGLTGRLADIIRMGGGVAGGPAADLVEGAGSYLPDNPVEAASSFVSGLTGVANRDPMSDSRFLALSPRAREEALRRREDADLIPSLIGGTAPYFATGALGPLAPAGAAGLGILRAGAQAFGSAPGSEGEWNPELAPEQNEAILTGRLTREGLSQAAQAWIGARVGALANGRSVSFSPGMRAVLARAASGVGEIGGQAVNDIALNLENHGTDLAKWTTSGKKAYLIAAIAGVALDSGAHLDRIYLQDASGRIGEVGTWGGAREVDPATVPGGATVLEFRSVAPERMSFDSVFSAEGTEAPGAIRGDLYARVNGPDARRASSDLPDLDRVTADPDAYREELLSRARAAEAIGRVAAGEHLEAEPGIAERMVADADAGAQTFPDLVEMAERDPSSLAAEASSLRRRAGGIDEALLSPHIAGRHADALENEATFLEGNARHTREAADRTRQAVGDLDTQATTAERRLQDDTARREAAEAAFATVRAKIQSIVAAGGDVDLAQISEASAVANELARARQAEASAASVAEAARRGADDAKTAADLAEREAKAVETRAKDAEGLRARGRERVDQAAKALQGRRGLDQRALAEPKSRARIEAEVARHLAQTESGLSEKGAAAAARVVVNAAERLGASPGVDPEAPLAQRIAAVADVLTGERSITSLFQQGGADLGARAVYDEAEGRIFLGRDANALNVPHELLHAARLRKLLDPAEDAAMTTWARAYYAANRDAVLEANPALRNQALSERQRERNAIEEVLSGALEGYLREGRLPSGAQAVEGAFADLAAIGKEIYEPVFASHLVDTASLPADIRAMFSRLVGADLVNASERVVDLGKGEWKAKTGAAAPVEFGTHDANRLWKLADRIAGGGYAAVRADVEALAREWGSTVPEARRYLEDQYKDFRRQLAAVQPGETATLEARLPHPVAGDSPETIRLKTTSRNAANAVLGTKLGKKPKPDLIVRQEREVAAALSSVLGRPALTADVDEHLAQTMPPEWFDRAAEENPDDAARYQALGEWATKLRVREARRDRLANAPDTGGVAVGKRDLAGVAARVRPSGDDPRAFTDGLERSDYAREAAHARAQAELATRAFRRAASDDGPHSAMARELYDAVEYWKTRAREAGILAGERPTGRGRAGRPAAQVIGGEPTATPPATTPATAETGIPDGTPLPPEKIAALGKRARVKTGAGTQVDVEYAIVDRGNLTTSHDRSGAENPDYPSTLQPRDRTRLTSEAQITDIAAKLDPEQVAESYLADSGAPVVGPDGLVESGNGRVLGIEEAYANVPESAARYREWLTTNAERFGLDPAKIDGVERPVLVRIRRSGVDRAQFAAEANARTTGEMSASERARADARVLTPELLATFRPGENGEIGADSNTEFIRSFFRAAVPDTELARYVTADGQISREGVMRIQNAIIAQAYGTSDAVEALSESTDSNVKNILAGMVQAAPRVAQVRAAAAERGLDIGPEISAAMQKLSTLRADGMSVSDYLAQGDMFGGGLSDIARDILVEFDANARSPRRIQAVLEAYADGLDALADPRQATMFGPPPDVSKADLLTAALERAKEVDDARPVESESRGVAPAGDAEPNREAAEPDAATAEPARAGVAERPADPTRLKAAREELQEVNFWRSWLNEEQQMARVTDPTKLTKEERAAYQTMADRLARHGALTREIAELEAAERTAEPIAAGTPDTAGRENGVTPAPAEVAPDTPTADSATAPEPTGPRVVTESSAGPVARVTLEGLPKPSTSLAGRGFDPETGTIAVQFKGGATWHYPATAEEWTDFQAADSAGSWFAKNLRGRVGGTKVADSRDTFLSHSAGETKGGLEFADAMHRRLYQLGRDLAAEQKGRPGKARDKRLAKIEEAIGPLAEDLQVTPDEARRFAADVYTDAQGQLEGMQSGETRQISDRVGRGEKPPLEAPAEPGKVLPFPGRVRLSFEPPADISDVGSEAVEDWHARVDRTLRAKGLPPINGARSRWQEGEYGLELAIDTRTAERIGRVLDEYGATVDEEDLATLEAPAAAAARAKRTSRDTVEEKAEKGLLHLLASGGVKALRTVRDASKAFVLMGPATDATNISSNALQAMAGEVRDMQAAPLDMLAKTLISGKRSRTWSARNAAEALGVTFSWKDAPNADALDRSTLVEIQRGGLRKALLDLRLIPKPDESYRGTEAPEQEQLEMGKHGIFPKLSEKSAAGLASRFNDHVFSKLSAEDALFYTYHLRKGLGDAALTRAFNEGLKGADARARRAELMEAPPQDLVDIATADAMSETFKNSTVPHKVVEGMRNAASSVEGLPGEATRLALDLLIPFSQTPSSILVKGFDLMGGSAIRAGSDLVKLRRLVKEGALDDFDRMPEVLALQRHMTGHAANALLGAELAGAVFLTGIAAGARGIIEPLVADEDEKARSDMRQQGVGFKGGRIRLGGYTFDLTSVGALGSLLLVAAAAGQSWEREKSWSGAAGSVLGQAGLLFLDSPLMQGGHDLWMGVSGAARARSQDEQTAKEGRRDRDRFLASQAQRFIPGSSLLGAIARASDVDRKAETFGDMIKSGIPGVRKSLPPRDPNPITGEPEQGRGLLNFMPFSPQRYRGDNPAIRVAVDFDLKPPPDSTRRGEDADTAARRNARRKEVWREAVRVYAGDYAPSSRTLSADERKRLGKELRDKVNDYVETRIKREFPERRTAK